MSFATIRILLAAYLVQGIIFGAITRYLSESKGYNGGFAWEFLLGLIGLLVVGFRPDNAKQSMAPGQSIGKGTWTCSCGSKNSMRLEYCPICRKTRQEAEDRKCPHCGMFNRATRVFCWSCGKPLGTFPNTSVLQDPAMPFASEKAHSSRGNASWLDVLERLARLQEQGALTEEEFQQKKKEVLRES